MPRYFFHIQHNGYEVEDPEGSDYVDLSAAEIDAVATLRDLVASALVHGSESNLEAINVADRNGRRSRVSVPNVIETVFPALRRADL
jgi:hypothetical protein